MKRVILILITLIMLSSCKYGEDIDESSLNLNSNKELNGKLIVKTYFDGYMLKRAQEFMRIHPKVKIVIPGFDNIESLNEEDFETYEMYSKRISTELMSGTVGDLVDVARGSYYKYAKSNLLCNLYEFMNNDKSFQIQDYYTNIFEAMEYNKGLYTLPLKFCYDIVFVNRTVINELELTNENYSSINLEKMLEMYDRYQELNPKNPYYLTPGLAKNRYFNYEIAEYFNFEIGTAQFTDSNFINYLKRTKALKVEEKWTMNRVSLGDDLFMKDKYIFSQTDLNVIDAHNLLIDYENVIDSVLFSTNAGNICFSSNDSVYAIPQSSQNKELAWHFLKFCIEQKNINENTLMDYFYDYNGCIPINRANFYSLFKTHITKDLALLSQNLNDENEIDNVLIKINNWNEQCNKVEADFGLWTLIERDLECFYKQQNLSAEMLAELIQHKVLAYLNE